MTSQWQHQYRLENGKTIGLGWTTPFEPAMHGFPSTLGGHTACRNGFLCEFVVKGEICTLSKLLIKLSGSLMHPKGQVVPIDAYPHLNGVVPQKAYGHKDSRSWWALYKNIGLNFKTPYDVVHNVDHVKHGNLFSPGNQFDCFQEDRCTCSIKKNITPENHTNFYSKYTSNYDIIGDIHGNADALKKLLKKRQFPIDGQCSRKRKLIFLGDFIDRGKQNKEVIEIIRKLVCADKALAVMGNHEYNAICYHTKSNDKDSDFLRKHSGKNKSQHIDFLSEYEDKKEKDLVIKWFRRLPIFLDFVDFRVVHACWEQEAIDFVTDKYSNYLTDEFLHKSVIKGCREHKAIETLLKGPEASLKENLSFYDSDNNKRTNFRVKWWKENLNTLGDAAILPYGSLEEYLDDELKKHCKTRIKVQYPPDAPPVFFGHYAALPENESFTKNTACLDCNITDKNGKLACYCWKKANKDLPLSIKKITSVKK